MVADRKPGRGSDQFPLRFPDGMREEIKRLADEDGVSMNSKIIELLNFAIENSGLDIDALLRGTSDLRAAFGRQQMLMDKQQELAASVLWHVLSYADNIPVDLLIWADNLLRLIEAGPSSNSKLDEVSLSDALESKADLIRRIGEIKKRQKAFSERTVSRILQDRGEKIEDIRRAFNSNTSKNNEPEN